MFLSDSPHDKYWTSLHQLHMWSAHTSVQNYIQSSEMDKDGTWGSKVEIFTLAHMLPTNITLVMSDMPVGIFSARPMSTEVRQLMSSKVVCHGLGNLISCLHDIMFNVIGPHWNAPSVKPAGLYTRYDIKVLGYTRHHSSCLISL